VEDAESRMQVHSGGIEFDCCQGEVFCCRDLGRFRKSENVCVTGWDGSRWRRNVRKGGAADRQAHRRRASRASRAAGGRARGRGCTGAAAVRGGGQPGVVRQLGTRDGEQWQGDDFGVDTALLAVGGRGSRGGVRAGRSKRLCLRGVSRGRGGGQGPVAMGRPRVCRVSGAENW
jgi:hypothetical protein